MNELCCNVPPDTPMHKLLEYKSAVNRRGKNFSVFSQSIDQVYNTKNHPWMYSIFKLQEVIEINISKRSKDVKIWDFLFPPLSKHLQEMGLNSLNENMRLMSVIIYRTIITSLLNAEEFEKGAFSFPYGTEGELEFEETKNKDDEIEKIHKNKEGSDTSSSKISSVSMSPTASVSIFPSSSPFGDTITFQQISSSSSTSVNSSSYNRHYVFLSPLLSICSGYGSPKMHSVVLEAFKYIASLYPSQFFFFFYLN
jgi:hypothetical protein